MSDCILLLQYRYDTGGRDFESSQPHQVLMRYLDRSVPFASTQPPRLSPFSAYSRNDEVV